MSDFKIEWPEILHDEGLVFTDDPDDSGGATKFGLTLKFCQENNTGINTLEQLKNSTPQQAEEIYEKFWWDKFNLSTIDSQLVADKLCNIAINTGVVSVVKALQSSLNSKFGSNLQVDGLIGMHTITITNNYVNGSDEVDFMSVFKANIWQHYESVLLANPKDEKFRNGWHTRVFS